MDVVLDGWAWIKKSDLSPGQLELIRSALTIIPRKMMGYGDEEPKPVRLFKETDDLIGVAREYFMAKRKPGHVIYDKTVDGALDKWPGPMVFKGSPRPEQEQAIATAVAALYSGARKGCILQAPPGWGKTVACCLLMATIQRPTLVIVHKDFLLKQWEERIRQFLPNAKIGRVQQDECDYLGKHIVLGMVHSLASRDYGEDFYKYFGLVLTDECHRIGAETWSVVPPKFYAKYRVGVTATPRRKDGAEDVFRYHFGDVIFKAKEQRLKPKIRKVWTTFELKHTGSFNPNLATRSLVLKFMCTNTLRNKLIIEQVIEAVKAGRKCLVLSERLKHLSDLEFDLIKMWPSSEGPAPTMDHYVGGREDEELDKAAKAQVIFATVQFASEGLDIPAIDTLFLTTPIGDAEQAVGRILRPHPDKKPPIVVDFRDDRIPLCKRLAEGRDRLYSKIT